MSFNGEGYVYWKLKMKRFLSKVWILISTELLKNSIYPTHQIDGVVENKPKDLWTKKDKENHHHYRNRY